jgi:hypothetical protein
MHPVIRRLVVVATTVAVAVGTFWFLVRIAQLPWQTTEYGFITVFSIPLGALVLLLERPIRRHLRHRRLLYAAAGLIAGLVAAVGWTLIAYVLTGGYLLAADANPLVCWTVAAIVASAVNLSVRDAGVIPSVPQAAV